MLIHFKLVIISITFLLWDFAFTIVKSYPDSFRLHSFSMGSLIKKIICFCKLVAVSVTQSYHYLSTREHSLHREQKLLSLKHLKLFHHHPPNCISAHTRIKIPKCFWWQLNWSNVFYNQSLCFLLQFHYWKRNLFAFNPATSCPSACWDRIQRPATLNRIIGYRRWIDGWIYFIPKEAEFGGESLSHPFGGKSKFTVHVPFYFLL